MTTTTVYLVDTTGDPAAKANLGAIAKALNTQALAFAEAWGLKAIEVDAVPTIAAVPSGAPRIVIVQDPPSPDEYGDHTETQDDLIVGTVATFPIFASGGGWTSASGAPSVSSVLSHELLELWKNPFGNAFCIQYATGRFFPLEMCDWVQAMSYQINGVLVSNFLYPAAFDESAPESAQFDQLRALTAPFSIGLGGYSMYYDAPNLTVGELGSRPKHKTASTRYEKIFRRLLPSS